MRSFRALLVLVGLGLALACGGSDSASPSSRAVPAKGLAYTDPAGTGWRLVKDATSTPTRLVLNLVGPVGLKSRGVGFNLQGAPGVRFAAFETSDRVTTGLPIRDTGVYFLWNTDPRDPNSGDPMPRDPLEPKLLAGGVKKGNVLTVGIFQKDRREPAKDSGAALCQIALGLDESAKAMAGDLLALTVTKAGYLPEDIGAFSVHPTVEMEAKGHVVAMPIALGTLVAK